MGPLLLISTRPRAQRRPHPTHIHVPPQNAVKVSPREQLDHRRCDMAHTSLVPATLPARMAGTAMTVPLFSGEQVTRLPTDVSLVLDVE